MKTFSGKTALITGAASGIGRALSLVVARRGAALALADIDALRLEQTAAQRRALGAHVHTFHVDLADKNAVEELAREVVAATGGVDVLVNNAGVAVVAPLLETREDDWEWIFAINVWAPIR